MDPYTHLATGILLGSLPPAQGLGWAGTAAAVAGSLVPDLDFLTRKLGGTRFLYHHHGATHSLPGLVLLSTGCAGVIALLAGSPWTLLTLITLAGALLHVLLDLLMHNTGVQLLFPWRRKRVAHPLVIGVNPPVLSPDCGDGRYRTCLICQLRSSLRNPIWWILMTGGVGNLLLRLARQNRLEMLWSTLCLVAAALYLVLAERQRRRARRLAGMGRSALVVPAAQGWSSWLALERRVGAVLTRLVDLRSGSVEESRFSLDGPQDPLVRATESLPDVIRFNLVAAVPHARVIQREPETVVEWRDLSYAYPSPFPLFSLRVTLDEACEPMKAEFRERW